MSYKIYAAKVGTWTLRYVDEQTLLMFDFQPSPIHLVFEHDEALKIGLAIVAAAQRRLSKIFEPPQT